MMSLAALTANKAAHTFTMWGMFEKEMNEAEMHQTRYRQMYEMIRQETGIKEIYQVMYLRANRFLDSDTEAVLDRQAEARQERRMRYFITQSILNP